MMVEPSAPEPSGPATPHRLIDPPEMAAAVGFSHVVVPANGRTVYLAGQAGHHRDGSLSDGLLAQFEQATRNVADALAAAGAGPQHLVSAHVYTTDVVTYRASTSAIGAVWRRHLGRHFPAMALFEVTALFDAAAEVELVAIAVVPDDA